MKEKFLNNIVKFLSDRLISLSIITFFMFCILAVRLFDLQIVNSENYVEKLNTSATRTIDIKAPRGGIYDRYGRPLATNKSVFVVKIDRNMFDNMGNPLIVSSTGVQILADKAFNLNMVLYNLVKLFEQNNENYIDDFPISKTEPFEFLLNNDKNAEIKFKKSLHIPNEDDQINFDAAQVIKYLRKYFSINPDLNNIDARNILSLRVSLFLKSYTSFYPILLAYDVGNKTITSIEEESDLFHGIIVETESLRYYPQGKYFSNIIGYLGKITSEELDDLQQNGLEYKEDDLIGKEGIEKFFEKDLVGIGGKMTVEVNSLNKKVSTLNEQDPTRGNKLFLTIDKDIQMSAYNNLEKMLKRIIINKLKGVSVAERRITDKQLLISMIKSNNISISKALKDAQNPQNINSITIKNIIFENIKDFDRNDPENLKQAVNLVSDFVEKNIISTRTIVLLMQEQNIISDDALFSKFKNSNISVLTLLIEKIELDEITPQMTNLDPSTGSVVVVDINSGALLASVGYPSFDNNKYRFDVEYTNKVLNDPTRPLYNRAFLETRAPGSTFKMITAVAALESGVVSPKTTIYDEVVFKKAGLPYAHSWNKNSFGHVDVSTALEISNNYYFYETSYLMGTTNLSSDKYHGISTLNKYMKMFGLNDRTGVEIFANIPNDAIRISSPELKKEKFKNSPENAEWKSGDTIRTAIGQSLNSYSAATMAKYIATLANKGTRYSLHLVDKIETNEGSLVMKTQKNIEQIITLKESTWSSIFDGMLRVTKGSRGTARNVFNNFPITVLGKTGTAQEIGNRNDHSSFGGFAPAQNPEIAVYVVLPFGDTRTVPASATQIAKEIIADYMGIYAKPDKPTQENALIE